MKKKVLSYILDNALLAGCKEVIVALSGGADSVALLHIMLGLKDELGIAIKAAHLNHCLRGEESDSDEAFCRELCDRLGVELFVKRADVAAYAKERKLGTELAAREVRYDFLNSLGGFVATAHTASDNLETVILNLIRGTSLKGLSGIPQKRDNIIRPLLCCTRAEIEEYCAANSLEFVTDSSNLSDDYSRNRVRHHIVPRLLELNPAAEASVLRMGSLIRQDERFLQSLVDEKMSLFENEKADISELLELDDALLSRLLIKVATDYMGCSPDNNAVNIMLGLLKTGGAVQLNSSVTFYAKQGKAWFAEAEECSHSYEVECSQFVLTNEDKVNSLLLKSIIDCDKICGNLIIRNRLPEDKIKISGRGVTKTLKKLFCEAKLSKYERSVLPVAADDNGVVWVCGFGVDERCAVSDSTKRAIKLETRKICSK